MAVVIQEKIKSAPAKAGVYLMKDASGRVIYIGKAKSLKQRLSSYLGRDLSSKNIALLSKVADIEYRICPNETFALLLEAELVHKYKPQYNISLRDDKSFPLVQISDEEFPRIFIARRRQKNKARYFGPYTSAKLIRGALKIIRRHFPYRSCKRLPKDACIYWRLGLCPAPCTGKISQRDYARNIKSISLLLEGKSGELIKALSGQMSLEAKNQKFEAAAKIRDQLNALAVLTKDKSNFTLSDELEDLKGLLKLKVLPLRIEAFDISNIFGQEACGSMVSFYNGVMDKDSYRRFRIKTIRGIDDYGMLREVINRRYSRLTRESLPLPDLVLIDGGRPHLLTADKEIKRLGISIPLVSIAKGKENIYTGHKIKPIKLNSDTPALNLIRRIRDEAHRFALNYHHLLRRKKIIGK